MPPADSPARKTRSVQEQDAGAVPGEEEGLGGREDLMHKQIVTPPGCGGGQCSDARTLLLTSDIFRD